MSQAVRILSLSDLPSRTHSTESGFQMDAKETSGTVLCDSHVRWGAKRATPDRSWHGERVSFRSGEVSLLNKAFSCSVLVESIVEQ